MFILETFGARTIDTHTERQKKGKERVQRDKEATVYVGLVHDRTCPWTTPPVKQKRVKQTRIPAKRGER